jgi:hypothetical protein
MDWLGEQELREWMNKQEIIERAVARDRELEQIAIEAARANDDENVWLAMAARAENKRFLDRLAEIHPDYPENVRLP